MIVSTTDTLQGRVITDYLGIVTGETISGANFVRDMMATVTDYIGGRSGAYEEVLQKSRQSTLDELEDRARRLGADAIVGVSFDYETIGGRGAMIMVTATGTAVKTAIAV
ncbi:MAG: YbjQ family protein [Hyphomicrobiaceae bacterium]|nr:YbjQ family protein [Hyphomicrobiaceae bacterium]